MTDNGVFIPSCANKRFWATTTTSSTSLTACVVAVLLHEHAAARRRCISPSSTQYYSVSPIARRTLPRPPSFTTPTAVARG